MKICILLVSLLTFLSTGLAQLAGFQGTTLYQQGMSLSEAQSLATVSQEDAIAAAQTLTGNNAEASAEVTVVDGYLVWAVDIGSERVYVDVNDASLGALATTPAYTANSGDDDDEAEDDGAENEHEDEGEHEDDDGNHDGGVDNDDDGNNHSDDSGAEDDNDDGTDDDD